MMVILGVPSLADWQSGDRYDIACSFATIAFHFMHGHGVHVCDVSFRGASNGSGVK